MIRQRQAHLSRRHLDSRLEAFRGVKLTESPKSGWIRAIRDGLGMTGAQLARRLGVKQPTVSEFEHNEASRRITLETLDRAAAAMGCRLVYALVPEQPLETTVRLRAREAAKKKLAHVGRTMGLENQSIDLEAEGWQLEDLTQQLAASASSIIWDEE